jgi:hypothetical protein
VDEAPRSASGPACRRIRSTNNSRRGARSRPVGSLEGTRSGFSPSTRAEAACPGLLDSGMFANPSRLDGCSCRDRRSGAGAPQAQLLSLAANQWQTTASAAGSSVSAGQGITKVRRASTVDPSAQLAQSTAVSCWAWRSSEALALIRAVTSRDEPGGAQATGKQGHRTSSSAPEARRRCLSKGRSQRSITIPTASVVPKVVAETD